MHRLILMLMLAMLFVSATARQQRTSTMFVPVTVAGGLQASGASELA